MSTAAPRPPAKPRTRGPVELVFVIAFGLFFVALFSWFIGLVIEIGGSYFFWKQGPKHAQQMVEQDMSYIAAAPRSLLIDDTVAFSNQLVAWIRMPYERVGILGAYERKANADTTQPAPVSGKPDMRAKFTETSKSLLHSGAEWAVISMYVLQDVLLRLSVALFALPAFLLACMVGVVDGLVRRDLRRWQGGRESSFVYHHAKNYTKWALTGGFGLYLTWPFGGFNPAYMVLVFTVLVAATLSTTVASFKKYL